MGNSKDRGAEPESRVISRLWIEEAQQFFFFVLAKGRTNAHMAHYGAGNAGRKPLGRIMAARTVLFKDALTFIPMLLRTVCRRRLIFAFV
jgi:hypothetical protein